MPVDRDDAAVSRHAPHRPCVCVCVSSCFVFLEGFLTLYCLLWSSGPLWSSNFGPCGDNRVLSKQEGGGKGFWECKGFSLTVSVSALYFSNVTFASLLSPTTKVNVSYFSHSFYHLINHREIDEFSYKN